MSHTDKNRADELYRQGRYQEALGVYLKITRNHPALAYGWKSAAVCCVLLARWQDAVDCAQNALKHDASDFAVYDALASAYGELGQWDKARHYGLQALTMRDRRFGGEPVIPLSAPPPPFPSMPSAQTRERNVIAFSLFGGDSKYCEPAVLSVQEQPRVYPHWVCRFYVDRSVPESVLARLRASGGRVIFVEEPTAQLPGPMWRFLALSDPLVDRVLFRDADSVISSREAGAVAQWLTSGKRFHVMRDWSSHTELMLAGLWGVVKGSLPPLNELMDRFMSEPLKLERFAHFADQYFLRQYVWPYARASLMQHDSVFGFMEPAGFPDGERPDGVHVGGAESGSFTARTDLPDGLQVIWSMYLVEKREGGPSQEKLVCTYPATVKGGLVQAQIPDRYARGIRPGSTIIRLHHAPIVRTGNQMTRIATEPGTR